MNNETNDSFKLCTSCEQAVPDETGKSGKGTVDPGALPVSPVGESAS
jgi:hypothetical protein